MYVFFIIFKKLHALYLYTTTAVCSSVHTIHTLHIYTKVNGRHLMRAAVVAALAAAGYVVEGGKYENNFCKADDFFPFCVNAPNETVPTKLHCQILIFVYTRCTFMYVHMYNVCTFICTYNMCGSTHKVYNYYFSLGLRWSQFFFQQHIFYIHKAYQQIKKKTKHLNYLNFERQ